MRAQPVEPSGPMEKDSRYKTKVNRHRLNSFLKCLFSWQLNKNNNYNGGRKGYGTPRAKVKSLLWIGTKLSSFPCPRWKSWINFNPLLPIVDDDTWKHTSGTRFTRKLLAIQFLACLPRNRGACENINRHINFSCFSFAPNWFQVWWDSRAGHVFVAQPMKEWKTGPQLSWQTNH